MPFDKVILQHITKVQKLSGDIRRQIKSKIQKRNRVSLTLNQIKSSLYSRYYAKARNEWRSPSSQLAPEQHRFEEMSQQWQAVGDSVSDLTDSGVEPQTSRTNSVYLTTELICNDIKCWVRDLSVQLVED